MTINDYIHIIAGTFIIISLSLGTWVNPYWYLLSAFVGINLYTYLRFSVKKMTLKSA
jgi:hypothetical protein